MDVLPGGHTFRSPQLSDAETIHQLVTDYLTNLLGRSPVSLSEVVESFTAATFDPEHDGWLVLDGTGHGDDSHPACSSSDDVQQPRRVPEYGRGCRG
jgi:hypothetical protein